MRWKKVKQIFDPSSNLDCKLSHAANPVPFVLNEDSEIVRVFFTYRNLNNVSHIGYVDFNFKNDFEIIKTNDKPLIGPGTLGLFDDSGTSMGYLIEFNQKFYLFYLAWNLRVTVPWLNTIGLAISSSIDGPFEKVGKVPIMDRSNEDPFSISYPSILREGNLFKMWYGSNLSWGRKQSDMNHVIKYAHSIDLINWKRSNQIHIPLSHVNEYAISKPWVLRKRELYQMFYSCRGNTHAETYRIGYADSPDGLNWTRKDHEIGIDISPLGWDSEMICYPSIFELKNKIYMLYNGNGYGKTGFGISILEE
jgi:hypothetical protein